MADAAEKILQQRKKAAQQGTKQLLLGSYDGNTGDTGDTAAAHQPRKRKKEGNSSPIHPAPAAKRRKSHQ